MAACIDVVVQVVPVGLAIPREAKRTGRRCATSSNDVAGRPPRAARGAAARDPVGPGRVTPCNNCLDLSSAARYFDTVLYGTPARRRTAACGIVTTVRNHFF